MEVSAMPPMPLDFSMVRSGGSSPNMRESSPRPVSNSAFRVVTPKGKTGKIYVFPYHLKIERARVKMRCGNEIDVKERDKKLFSYITSKNTERE
ncbi:unnamed protein product [Euphydryas editha]|uniref:Uncharacterized protein n=1 Tax=Euphydryas editha TaxID=104508 RepID=A0AAU9V5H3_EUPED|nr:unnamed protein product [Euphydryas editha]